MKKITYIVIDESGATHQKENDYFVIGGYITQQIYSVKSTHKKIEKEIKEKNNTKLIVESVKNIIINGEQ